MITTTAGFINTESDLSRATETALGSCFVCSNGALSSGYYWMCVSPYEITRGHLLALTLLVANLANTKWCKKPWKWFKPWHMGTHLRREYSVRAIQWIPTWQGLDDFLKSLGSCAKVASALEGLKSHWSTLSWFQSRFSSVSLLKGKPLVLQVCVHWLFS